MICSQKTTQNFPNLSISIGYILSKPILLLPNQNAFFLKLGSKRFCPLFAFSSIFLGVINQNDLIFALENGKIAMAGLDVMVPEPLPIDHRLTKLKNCVLIPHIGSATIQTRTKMATLTAENLIQGIQNLPMPAQLC